MCWHIDADTKNTAICRGLFQTQTIASGVILARRGPRRVFNTVDSNVQWATFTISFKALLMYFCDSLVVIIFSAGCDSCDLFTYTPFIPEDCFSGSGAKFTGAEAQQNMVSLVGYTVSAGILYCGLLWRSNDIPVSAPTTGTYIHKLSSNMLHPTVIVFQEVYIEQQTSPTGTVLYQSIAIHG